MKDNGLDVKTSGPGRNKAAILSDVLALINDQESSSPAAPAPTPARPRTLSEDAAEAEEAVGAAPNGFEWGGTF